MARPPQPWIGRSNPTDPRAANDYSSVQNAGLDECVTANANATASTFNNEKAFFDCADAKVAALAAAGGQPAAQPGATAAADWTQNPTDQRASNDYSGIANAGWDDCVAANADASSPSFNNETAFFDCADAKVAALAAAGGQPAAQPGATAAADWTQSPTDQRANNDYSGIANAGWDDCVAANADASSPSFNNETAFFDCADAKVAALAAAGGQPAAQPGATAAADWTQSPTDQRASNDYSGIANAGWDDCVAANADATSPSFNNETAFFDCADAKVAALAAAGGQPDAANAGGQDAGSYDPNTDPAYSSLPADVLVTCNRDTSCLDAAVSQASSANAQAADPRAANDYSALPMGYLSTCAQDYGEGSSPYYDCLDAAVQQEAANAQQAPAADPRAANDYSALPMGYLSTCAQDYGEGSSPYYDCLDAAVQQEAANAQQAPAADPRAANDYSALPMGYLSTCAQDYGEGSSPYYDCLDAAVQQEAVNAQQPPATDQTTGQEPGSDRATVLYQEAHDYCVGQLQLADGSQEYTDCYYAYPN